MCLAVLAVDAHEDWPLVIAANRDEFHGRMAVPAAFWPDAPEVIGGRDVQGGGTWLAARRDGRFALLTNVREPARFQADAPSRGHLVSDFVRGDWPASAYVAQVAADPTQYNGFNLLVGDASGVHWVSNRPIPQVQTLVTGVHGLSNAALNTPWPKVERARAALQAILQDCTSLDDVLAGALQLLQDRFTPADLELPDTGVGLALERVLGSAFIVGDTYGTRCSTVIAISKAGEITFCEQRYAPSGDITGADRWSWPARRPYRP